MSDRVAVMNKGVVEQVGTPQSIYDESATEFVCNFIGDSSRLTGEFVAELNRRSGARPRPGGQFLPAGGEGVPGTRRRGRRRPFRWQEPFVSKSYHGLHSRYVVRCHGVRVRLLVKEDGGAHPGTGPGTVYVQPRHVLQYHPETGASPGAGCRKRPGREQRRAANGTCTRSMLRSPPS